MTETFPIGGSHSGNHTQTYGLEQLCRSAYYLRELRERWDVPAESMLMVDNNGISWPLVTAYADAGIKYLAFLPNAWNPDARKEFLGWGVDADGVVPFEAECKFLGRHVNCLWRITMGISEQRYVDSHRAATRGVPGIPRQKTLDLASGSRPPPSSGDFDTGRGSHLDGVDERQDPVDGETPKILHLNRV